MEMKMEQKSCRRISYFEPLSSTGIARKTIHRTVTPQNFFVVIQQSFGVKERNEHTKEPENRQCRAKVGLVVCQMIAFQLGDSSWPRGGTHQAVCSKVSGRPICSVSPRSRPWVCPHLEE